MLLDLDIKLRRVGGFLQNRQIRTISLLFVYFLLAFISIWVSYQLRFDFFVNAIDSELAYRNHILFVALWVVPVKLIALMLFGQFSCLLGYFGTPDLLRVAKAVCVGTAVVAIVRVQAAGIYVPPRGVILIDFILTFMAISGFRIGCRLFREVLVTPSEFELDSEALRIGIIGAGDVGASLAKELLVRRGMGRRPVAFFDDDPAKVGTRIHNIPVVGKPEIFGEVNERLKIDEGIIAMPSASVRRIKEIVHLLQRQHTKFVTVPSLDQMATGKVKLTQLRPVEIQDLLGRAIVPLERESIKELVAGKVVLVTGAGGSIGKELCRQLGSFNPARLLMVDHSEFHLFEIEQELIESGCGGLIRPLVGSILDRPRIAGIVALHRPDVIFHAAALKHVPMMELQPSEAIKVNTLGTALLARIAEEFKVSRFVMISTDKAINPTSVMGATKRLAEIYLQAKYAAQNEKTTKFMAVRFGNVLGSSGSVIPTFKRQIEAGGPVKVTHPDVTRYFMTIPEAAGLVLQCGSQGEGGEIFVLDMGEPVKIVDLARQLIKLSGLRPEEDIGIEFCGLRQGEKLYEELQHSGENIMETQHPKITRFSCEAESLARIEEILQGLEGSINDEDSSGLKRLLNEAVPEYVPYV